MDLSSAKKRIAHAPETPGVYTWKDNQGRPLYIGKATNLRSRLVSYQRATHARIRMMVEKAARLDWQETPTDIEALILESQLIKRHRPPFNIDLRDDKSHFFVAITDEPFPQIILTHQIRSRLIKKPIREFIGPFTDGTALKTTLAVLRRLFPFCTCKQTHHVRCLNAHLALCPGYCCLRENSKFEIRNSKLRREYLRNIRAIRDILTGKREMLLDRITRRMRTAAARGELHEARRLQIQTERIGRVFVNAQLFSRRASSAKKHHGALVQMAELFGFPRTPSRIEGYDIAHIQGVHPAGAMVVFTDGSPDHAEYRLFNIRTREAGDTAALKEIAARRIRHAPPTGQWSLPDLMIVDGAKAQLNVFMRALDAAGLDIPVIALAKDETHRGSYILFSGDSQVRTLKSLPPEVRNLIVHVDEESHRFVNAHYRRRHRRHQLAS